MLTMKYLDKNENNTIHNSIKKNYILKNKFNQGGERFTRKTTIHQ